MLQNICNMDQTPVPFEYLERRTYNQIGEKSIWLQSSKSGWDKRQGTIELTAFADGVAWVKPLIFFRGKGTRSTIVSEQRLYDNRVVVKFNPTAYTNSSNMLEWLDEQLVPVLYRPLFRPQNRRGTGYLSRSRHYAKHNSGGLHRSGSAP